jgi:hypothetical protein
LNAYIQTDKEVRLLTHSIIKEKTKIKTL